MAQRMGIGQSVAAPDGRPSRIHIDGTWNTERSNTNVSRLFRQIADENSGSHEQRRFYDEGVGTLGCVATGKVARAPTQDC